MKPCVVSQMPLLRLVQVPLPQHWVHWQPHCGRHKCGESVGVVSRCGECKQTRFVGRHTLPS